MSQEVLADAGVSFRVVAIARGIHTLIPSGDLEVLPGDHVFVLAHAQEMPRLMALAGVNLLALQ